MSNYIPGKSTLSFNSAKWVLSNPAASAVKVEKISRSCRSTRRGAAVVEFAIVAPVFFLLVFGMIEYGRMVMVQQVITNASREGARVGVLDGATSANVTTAVNNYLTAARIPTSAMTLTINPSNPSSAGYGQPVTITVSIPFNNVSWLPTPLFLGGKTLTATSAMRREAVN